MTSPERSVSPLALAALALVAERATAVELDRRFAAEGLEVKAGLSTALLAGLAALGLVRVARETADGHEYVPTSLGRQMADGGLAGESADLLEDLERLRTDLLSTIAHELRTPLTAVRTSSSLLLDPTSRPTDEQRRALLESIERNADRMQRLVADILDLARSRSGTLHLQPRRFDAVAMAKSGIAAIAPLAEQRSQQVELVVVGEGTPSVYGDHRRLEQALVNLLSNAQHFAPEGGSIRVEVTSEAGWVRWSVTDDGPGIPPEDQARLFERFFVGRGDRSGPRQGVGLGLPTALAIAQAHGGTIDVVSRPGQGSTFTLAVPPAPSTEEP